MEMPRTTSKAVIALLLGIVGFCSNTAEAKELPRLLFLGISKDGRAQQQAETAAQVRLAGLEVVVIKANDMPPCENTECMVTALDSRGADIALTGRILKNEHACLATLWLMRKEAKEKPIEQEIVCRSDGKDSDLVSELADNSAAMVDDYLHNSKLDSHLNKQINSLEFQKKEKIHNMWTWKKKLLITGLSVLLAGEVITTITLSSIPPISSGGSKEDTTSLNLLRPEVAIAGFASGTTATLLLVLGIRK